MRFVETLASLTSNRLSSAVSQKLQEDEALAERVDYQADQFRMLLCLRDDFLNQLLRWRTTIPSLFDNRMELLPLTGAQALEIVARPSELRIGKPPIVSDEVARAIVHFVAEAGAYRDLPFSEESPSVLPDGAEPPLLSLVCSELNAERLAKGADQITMAQVENRAEDILKRFYDDCFRFEAHDE